MAVVRLRSSCLASRDVLRLYQHRCGRPPRCRSRRLRWRHGRGRVDAAGDRDAGSDRRWPQLILECCRFVPYCCVACGRRAVGGEPSPPRPARRCLRRSLSPPRRLASDRQSLLASAGQCRRQLQEPPELMLPLDFHSAPDGFYIWERDEFLVVARQSPPLRRQSSLACWIRSLDDETKFHPMWRALSIGRHPILAARLRIRRMEMRSPGLNTSSPPP